MRRIIIAYDGPYRDLSRSMPTNIEYFRFSLDSEDREIFCACFWEHVEDVDLSGGRHLADNIADGYDYIMNNYQPGDELFIFGVSRGAFAACALANLVARFGVLLRTDTDMGSQEAIGAYLDGNLDAFKVKKISPNERYDVAEGDLTPHAYDVDIEVLGCWDTVADAGGVSSRYDTRLVKGIKRAFHALALDECREPFTPRLWYLPDDPEVAKSIDLLQCWFPGAHNNIGGGYRDRALSDITLAWMIDRCSPFLRFNSRSLKSIVVNGRRPAERPWERSAKLDGKFDTEYQGWGRGMCYDSYWEGCAWTWKTRTPGAYGGGTNEMMHPSVRERWRTSREHGLTTGPAVWNPKALKGFTPRQKGDSNEWEWVKDGDTLMIPEAPFSTATESLEWQLRYASEAVPSSTEPEAVPKSMVGKTFSLTGYIMRLVFNH